jgi:hypothetical protein
MLMKRAWGPVLAGLSLVAGGVAVFTACVHDDSTIFVHDALAPKFAQMGSICTWTGDPMQAFIPAGRLDVLLSGGYEGGFLVGNQMVPQVNSNQLQTETSTVTLQGAVVRVTDRSGNVVGKPFTRLAAATIPPSSGGVPGYAAVFVRIVDSEAINGSSEIQQLLANGPGQGGLVRLVTYVRFFGKTLGGQSVESDEFEFPVDVCNGCLVTFTNNPSGPLPNCAGSATATMQTAQPQVPCIRGQDLIVDCSVVCQDIPSCAANTQAAAADAGAG